MSELELNKIHNIDCLEFMKTLPDKCIDLVLTDPPYGINVGKPFTRERERERVKVGGAKPFGKKGQSWYKGSIAPKSYLGFDDTRIPNREVFNEMIRISKNQIIFGGNYFVEHLSNSSCWLVWDKDNGKSFFADCELAWTSFKTAIRKYKWKWNGMLQEQMGRNKEERYHPTQKPVELMRSILRDYSKEGEIVFDPFLGSGSTAIACKLDKRNYIGCEISPEYCKIAEERIQVISNP